MQNLIIGFTEKYYTLWSYELIENFVTDSYGLKHKSGITEKYTYIKNISFDIENVKKLYPNTIINLELRGCNSFVRNTKNELPKEFFWFGKYYGKLISEVVKEDVKYCFWAADLVPYIKTLPDYINHLKELETQKNKTHAQEQEIIKNATKIDVNDVVELEFTSNGFLLENNSICFVDAKIDDTMIRIECSGFKEVNGLYTYIMPLINGKHQRTKNKKIKIKVLEVVKTCLIDNKVFQFIKI